MRTFSYFLYACFDADGAAENPNNPRNFLGEKTDALLSWVAALPANTCSYSACADRFDTAHLDQLIAGGILRCEDGILALDSPIFLREDAAALRAGTAAKAVQLADRLEAELPRIRACCSGIQNGFSVERNLYHLLCAAVFNGLFFDYLSAKGVLAVSRMHPSGLDYLGVIYEKCPELQSLSDGLLCSYNRFVNDRCSLQSFGDANGDRLDFYRFSRLMEQNRVPAKWADIAETLREWNHRADKDALLSEVVSLVQTGRCDPSVMAILGRFGYARDGKLCVPVYTGRELSVAEELEKIVEETLGVPTTAILLDLAGSLDITAVRHRVNRLEIANELYHLLFGAINEELVSRGIAAAPPDVPGEGRYFRCIECYA